MYTGNLEFCDPLMDFVFTLPVVSVISLIQYPPKESITLEPKPNTQKPVRLHAGKVWDALRNFTGFLPGLYKAFYWLLPTRNISVSFEYSAQQKCILSFGGDCTMKTQFNYSESQAHFGQLFTLSLKTNSNNISSVL